MHTAMTHMSTLLAEVTHIETGKLECGSSSSWTGREYGYDFYHNEHFRYTTVTQQFSKPYGRVPRVQWGVTHVYYYDNSGNYLIYNVDVVKVTETSFTVKCRIEDHSAFLLRGMTVSWASFPNEM